MCSPLRSHAQFPMTHPPSESLLGKSVIGVGVLKELSCPGDGALVKEEGSRDRSLTECERV